MDNSIEELFVSFDITFIRELEYEYTLHFRIQKQITKKDLTKCIKMKI